jgi:hypothetical protein
MPSGLPFNFDQMPTAAFVPNSRTGSNTIESQSRSASIFHAATPIFEHLAVLVVRRKREWRLCSNDLSKLDNGQSDTRHM